MGRMVTRLLGATALSLLMIDASGAADVKIGIIAPMTGQLASEGQDMENAVKLAIADVNARGGVLGSKITTVTADDACDPQQGAAAGSKLVSAGVTAIVGGYCSGAVLPTLKIYGDADIPFVIVGANSTKLVAANEGDAFLINSTGDAQALTAVDALKKRGVKRLAIIDEGDAYSSDLAKLVAASFTQGGGSVVDRETTTSGEQDFSTTVNNVKSKNADAVMWTAYHGGGALLTKQLRQAGYGGLILLGDGNNSPEYLQIAGDAADGVLLFSPPALDFLKSTGNYAETYKKAYNRDPGAYAALSYDAGELIAAAIAKAGSTDPKAVIAALKSSDYKGLAGEIRFSDKNTLVGSNFVTVVAKDGKWQRAE